MFLQLLIADTFLPYFNDNQGEALPLSPSKTKPRVALTKQINSTDTQSDFQFETQTAVAVLEAPEQDNLPDVQISVPPASDEQNRSTVVIKWSKSIMTIDGMKKWEDTAEAAGYQFPLGNEKFAGKNIVVQLTTLLNNFICEVSDVVDVIAPNETADQMIEGVTRLVAKYLDQGEELINSAIDHSLDNHQYIHIQELLGNYVQAFEAMYDAILQYPKPGAYQETPMTVEIVLHPDLCGQLYAKDLFAETSSHQAARIPYMPPRVGREVTYEEIANLYRTSRVNIRRIEQDHCYKQLRHKLKDFREYLG